MFCACEIINRGELSLVEEAFCSGLDGGRLGKGATGEKLRRYNIGSSAYCLYVMIRNWFLEHLQVVFKYSADFLRLKAKSSQSSA